MIIDRSLLYINKNDNPIQESSNLFEYSLNALIESNDIIINKLEEEAFVTEAWGDKRVKIFNLYGILDAIVGAFVNLIEKLIGRFLALLVTLAGQGRAFDLEARAFGPAIKEYRNGFLLSNVYKFTNLEAGKYPSTNLQHYFTDSLNKFITDFNSAVEGSSTASEAINKLKFTNEFDIENELNKFRSQLLEIPDSEISNEVFGQECFKIFRNKMDVPYDTYLFNGTEVYKNFYEPYFNNKKLQAEAKRDSRRIQNDCKVAKKELKRFTPNISKFYDQNYSDILNAYNNIQRNVCTLFDKECGDVVTLFGAKLQAYKDSYKQSQRVIMKCMQEIAKNRPFKNKQEGEW